MRYSYILPRAYGVPRSAIPIGEALLIAMEQDGFRELICPSYQTYWYYY